MFSNLLLLTDSYKTSHWKQYPAGTARVFSFLESRGGKYDETTFFGLRYLLLKYLVGQVVTPTGIAQAEKIVNAHMGPGIFNRAGWEYILQKHYGRLPLIIKAVPEGTTIPNHNVLLTIENTDPACAWLVNYVETLLVQLWYPITVCTQSRHMKLEIAQAMRETGAHLSGLPFKLHDFGYRGSTSVESAGIGGAAHLVNFMGTDTMAALELAMGTYNAGMPGLSIPAAEHSTIISWGREHEQDAYENMLVQYPEGLVAVVSDSYDIYNAVRHVWGEALHDRVMSRKGTVVIRPDSGDPREVVLRLLHILGEKFGYETNAAGYKVLHPNVRLIQGDGITPETVSLILNDMILNGWSIDNIAFGSGGGLLQKMDRDTLKFAMKCSAVQVNGQWRGTLKTPVGDASKRSKAGRLILCDDGTGNYTTSVEGSGQNLLVPYFHNGNLIFDQDFADIRKRAAI